MKLQLEKFGKTLISRELGREAFKAFQSTLRDFPKNEELEMDFSGVLTLSPSWADEFLTPIFKSYMDRVNLVNTQNSSVVESLKILNLI
ncbi:MAG TPA: hypothetical protein DEG92_03870 [Rikenellaceae bacterium]|nr:hypothetical protein [Rikenellaceae bacterium]